MLLSVLQRCTTVAGHLSCPKTDHGTASHSARWTGYTVSPLSGLNILQMYLLIVQCCPKSSAAYLKHSPLPKSCADALEHGGLLQKPLPHRASPRQAQGHGHLRTSGGPATAPCSWYTSRVVSVGTCWGASPPAGSQGQYLDSRTDSGLPVG